MLSGQMALPLVQHSEDYRSLLIMALYWMEIPAGIGFMRSGILNSGATLSPRLTPLGIIPLQHECLFTSEEVLFYFVDCLDKSAVL